MASFCSGCGFPQSVNAAFCPNCGARVQGAASAPHPVQPAAAAAPAGTSSALKIVLVIVGLMGVCGIAAVGGMFYLAHRVKAAVVEKAKEYGVDLPQTTSHTSATPAHIPKPCDALSKPEVATLLGQPIERTELHDNLCAYYGPPGLSASLAQANANRVFQNAAAPGAKPNAGEMATAVEQLAGSSGGLSQLTGSNGEMPLLMVTLDPDGKGAMMAMGIANGLFSGIVTAAGAPKGSSGFDEIPGLGDRAIRTPKLGLHVLKGELAIGVILGPVPDPNKKDVAVARAILGKL